MRFATFWSLPWFHPPSFVVYTDHNTLVFLYRMHNHNQRLMFYPLLTQGYYLNIRHKKESDNIIADALSRAWKTSFAICANTYVCLGEGTCYVPERKDGGVSGNVAAGCCQLYAFQIAKGKPKLGWTNQERLVLTWWIGFPVYPQISHTVSGDQLSRAIVLASSIFFRTCIFLIW